MSRFTKDSKWRIRDFSKRSNNSPESLYLNASGFKYIPNHPFSDEANILMDISMNSEDCRSVDAYWNMGTDISLLEVSVFGHVSNLDSGFYAHWRGMKKDMLLLTCITDSDRISRKEFEEVMGKFIILECIPTEQLRKKFKNQVKLA